MTSFKTWQDLWNQYTRNEEQHETVKELERTWSLIDEADLFEKDVEKFPKVVKELEKEEEKVIDIEDIGKDDPMPQPPRYPEPDECCGSGCRVCVYDKYETDYIKYENALEKWKERQEARKLNKKNRLNFFPQEF